MMQHHVGHPERRIKTPAELADGCEAIGLRDRTSMLSFLAWRRAPKARGRP